MHGPPQKGGISRVYPAGHHDKRQHQRTNARATGGQQKIQLWKGTGDHLQER